jgi:hypothetical protein
MVAYSFKPRFVVPIRAGLGLDAPPIPLVRPKRQTIRAIGKRRHARPGEQLQLYQGMRTRDCFLIGEARCVNVVGVRVHVNGGRITIAPGTRDEHAFDKAAQLDAFAQRDGFDDWSEMQEFWREEHGHLAQLGPFVGLLILWEPKT